MYFDINSEKIKSAQTETSRQRNKCVCSLHIIYKLCAELFSSYKGRNMRTVLLYS